MAEDPVADERVFDEAWRRSRREGRAATGVEGASASLRWKVKLAPRTFEEVTDVYLDGVLVEVREPTDADDCLLEIDRSDFEAIDAGESDPVLAFMRGTLRLTGSRSAFFAVAPALLGPEESAS